MSYSQINTKIDEVGFTETFKQLVFEFSAQKAEYKILTKQAEDKAKELRDTRMAFSHFASKLQNLRVEDSHCKISQIVEDSEGEKRLAILNLVDKENRVLRPEELEIEFVKITDLESLDKEPKTE